MERAQANRLLAQRNAILGLLLALAAAAWALLAWRGMGRGMDMTMTPLTMGMGAPMFLLTWAVMMVAMMFPTAAPMILTFHKVQAGKRQRGDTFVATWVFVAAYMLVWALSGIVAYAAAFVAEAIAARASLSPVNAARIGGGVLVAAGLYQLTPLKDLCLSKCRTPVGFILTSWREGTAGALHMGLLHGTYCLGCCWLLFVILFPLGIMNVAVMALITLIIFAEKTVPSVQPVARVTAAALVAYGAAVLVLPEALPTPIGSEGKAMTAPAASVGMQNMSAGGSSTVPNER